MNPCQNLDKDPTAHHQKSKISLSSAAKLSTAVKIAHLASLQEAEHSLYNRSIIRVQIQQSQSAAQCHVNRNCAEIWEHLGINLVIGCVRRNFLAMGRNPPPNSLQMPQAITSGQLHGPNPSLARIRDHPTEAPRGRFARLR